MSDRSSPVERRVSPVAGRRRFFRTARSRAIGLACGTVAAIGFLALGLNAAIHEKGIEQKPADTGSTVIAQITQSPPPIVAAVARAPVATTQQPPINEKSQISMLTPNYVMMPASSGSMFFDVPQPTKQAKEDAGQSDGHNKQNGDTVTQVAFKPSTIAGGKAGPAMNMTYVMRPQYIPCALDVAMDSTLAGSIMCHTTQDVLSQDHVMLMPTGTQIVGTYKNNVRNGQHRLFAFAGSAITKEGIPVPLDSGISDGLGRAGIEGDVDNHYMERFGAAILLSAAQAVVSLAQSSLSHGNNGNNTYLQFNSGNGPSDLASGILRSQIDIPPTISVPPGSVITIAVDHPVSFEDAIKVSLR